MDNFHHFICIVSVYHLPKLEIHLLFKVNGSTEFYRVILSYKVTHDFAKLHSGQKVQETYHRKKQTFSYNLSQFQKVILSATC